jgi:predicted ATP-dependent serine protease
MAGEKDMRQKKCADCGTVYPINDGLCPACASAFSVDDKNMAHKPDEFDADGNPLKAATRRKKADEPKAEPKEEAKPEKKTESKKDDKKKKK